MIIYRVIVTKKADNDEARIYEYILKKFGETHAHRFREKLISLFKIFSKQPFIGRPAKNQTALRVYLFSRQNKIVYKVDKNAIIILRILHTKTNLASKF